jgi:glutamate dehydrogenase
MAIRRVVEQIHERQESIARDALASSSAKDGPAEIVAAWSGEHEGLAARIDQCLNEVGHSGGDWSLAKLTVANAALGDLL